MDKSEKKFWEDVLRLPLLQGLSRDDVLNMAEHVRFNFHTAKPGARLAAQGNICQGLVGILGGDVVAECAGDERSYVLREWCHAPFVIEPRALFGLTRTYERSYVADGECRVLEIEKAAVRDVMLLYPTFRLNYLNTICFSHYRLERLRWRGRPELLERRIVLFLARRVLHPAGRKELVVHMTTLARELGVTRLQVSRALHILAERGLVELHRGRFVVPRFEQLLAY